MERAPHGSTVFKQASSITEGNTFKIGRYVLRERIGSGGFGVVRKAVNDENEEIVAIKVLDKTELKLHNMTQNVKKEITLLTTLRHPNIVRGLEVLNSRTKILLVMEYVGGGDLHTVLTEQKVFTEEEAKKHFRSLLACLSYCHDKGVYHRDLKLENLLLTTSGDLKVCDFGLASVRSMSTSSNDLCKTIVGTEDFSSPEILRNKPYKGDKADMWSAGIVLYIMLAGYCPFRGNSPRELAENIASCKYSFPHEFPRGARRIIQHLLVPDAKRRLSASEVMKDEWVSTNSSRSTSANEFVAKMSSSSPWHSVASAVDGPSSLASSCESNSLSQPSRMEETRSSRRVLSLSVNGSKRSMRFADGNGHSFYNGIAQATIPNFFELFKAMRDQSTGIVVQDRKWRFRTFPKCFIGSEAVSWIAEHIKSSRQEAIKLGQRFIDAGVFHHVVRAHDFEDQYLFYRWHSDDADNAWVANLRAYHPRGFILRPAHIVVQELLKELLQVCRSHQKLENCRAVDTFQVCRDKRFKEFLLSVGELQHAPLPLHGPEEHKLSFLVNLHNLLWLQARIHIGELDQLVYGSLKHSARQFQYAVQGIRISLEDIYVSLAAAMESPTYEEEQPSRRRRSSGISSKGGSVPNVSVMRLLGRSANHFETEAELRDALRPAYADPLVLFLISDGSPDSPPIQAVTGNTFSEAYLNVVAAEYLDTVVSIDEESLAVRYPGTVDHFRQATKIFDDKEFINVLYDICDGLPLAEKLKGLLDKSRKSNITASALRTVKSETNRSGLVFAPRMGPAHQECLSQDSAEG